MRILDVLTIKTQLHELTKIFVHLFTKYKAKRTNYRLDKHIWIIDHQLNDFFHCFHFHFDKTENFYYLSEDNTGHSYNNHRTSNTYITVSPPVVFS